MKLNLTPFTFPDHTTPKGRLPKDMRAQACWYYYLLAQKLKEKVGDSIDDQFGLLDGELWMDKRYEQLARTVAMIYQLDSPDEFLRLGQEVAIEAFNCKLPIPAPEYMRPLRKVVIL